MMKRSRGSLWAWVIRTVLGLVALVVLLFVLETIWGVLVYSPEYVYRVLAWGESDAFDWQKFPSHPLSAAPIPHEFEEAYDPALSARFANLAGVDDWESFLEKNQTQAFVVLHDGKIVYQGYFNGTQQNTMLTSFSVAKSFTSALIGIAIDEGAIHSVEDPITDYLPELASRDERFAQITIRDLLRMASGLEYQEIRFPGLNSDDPLTTYYTNQRWLALNNTHISEPPGQHFLYNKYHPQLLGMILERATGMSVTKYLQARLWTPMGMAYDGSWSTDSLESDFEKMETGVNARALDYARFGQLYLQEGAWDGSQLIPAEWVRDSTRPWSPNDAETYYSLDFPTDLENGYYGYMWWGFEQDGGYDYSAEGDKGQYIFVSPAKRWVIVRNGIDYGIPSSEWMKIFQQFVADS